MKIAYSNTIDKEQVLKHIEEKIAKYSDLVVDNLHNMHYALMVNNDKNSARGYGNVVSRQKAAIETLKDLAKHLESLPKEQDEPSPNC